MLHGTFDPLSEANVRNRLFGDLFLNQVVMDQLQMSELVQDKLGKNTTLKVNFIAPELARRPEYKISKIDQVQTLLDPEVEEFALEYLRQVYKWVTWHDLRFELTQRFGERFMLVYQIYYRDFSVFLARADIADNILGISRLVVASHSPLHAAA